MMSTPHASTRLHATSTRVFMNGNSQAVRIPQEFRLDCKQVEISRNADGDLVLHPLNAIGSRGDNLLQALAGFDADFVQALEADRRDPDAPQEREPL
ncbi:AbrB/MazE/SpoVT family DNA-binding domain-containing protein [Ottowia sp.]|jgi:antitoxin VapB|uniref:antitoxin n=1 Tax=Ottowia sp. TaxID=1898956 RepID=UPI0025EF37E6|nr:AbrB/MazE/SpoVT family DNA-binding domain-containing protein [Ottowia sp.]